MSEFVSRVGDLIRAGEVRISEHGYDELAEDGLTAREVLAGILEAVVIEEYVNYPKDRTSCSYRRTEWVTPSTWCGESTKAVTNQWSW